MAIYILYTLCTKLQISLAHREENRTEQNRGACAVQAGGQAWASRPAAPVWWRRGILGQPFPNWTKWPFVCSSGPWLAGLQHAIMLCSCLSFGPPTPKGSGREESRRIGDIFFLVGGDHERKTGGGRRREGEEWRRKQETRGEREKGCGLSPGCSPSRPPFPLRLPLQPSPSLACLTLHNGRFSAEISRYWIPGLEFCPPTMSRQRSMLQGRHTLQAKSWKTIPPFISIRKGEKSPLDTTSFIFFPPITPFPSPSLLHIKTGGRLSSTVKLH